ncbi:MAG: hypothetical protein RQ743_13980 [Bacteroidales bacterium]|nr:hypothetical protein [Bacteroidales bacterium]MDT8402792.1 hypothetical protein [Bacteroidales bacterium]
MTEEKLNKLIELLSEYLQMQAGQDPEGPALFYADQLEQLRGGRFNL